MSREDITLQRQVIVPNKTMIMITTTFTPSPPPAYGHLFVKLCFFILNYDSMSSKTDFTQEKSHFHPTSRIPNSYVLLYDNDDSDKNTLLLQQDQSLQPHRPLPPLDPLLCPR